MPTAVVPGVLRRRVAVALRHRADSAPKRRNALRLARGHDKRLDKLGHRLENTAETGVRASHSRLKKYVPEPHSRKRVVQNDRNGDRVRLFAAHGQSRDGRAAQNEDPRRMAAATPSPADQHHRPTEVLV